MQSTTNPNMHHYSFENILLISSAFIMFVYSLFDHNIHMNNTTYYAVCVMVLSSLIKGVSVFIGGAIARYFWNKITNKKEE